MGLSKLTAKHFKEIYFGGNWTTVNLKDTLSGINWQQAITQVYDFNTIATLTNHINYYVKAVQKVLEGKPDRQRTSLTFSHPHTVT